MSLNPCQCCDGKEHHLSRATDIQHHPSAGMQQHAEIDVWLCHFWHRLASSGSRALLGRGSVLHRQLRADSRQSLGPPPQPRSSRCPRVVRHACFHLARIALLFGASTDQTRADYSSRPRLPQYATAGLSAAVARARATSWQRRRGGGSAGERGRLRCISVCSVARGNGDDMRPPSQPGSALSARFDERPCDRLRHSADAPLHRASHPAQCADDQAARRHGRAEYAFAGAHGLAQHACGGCACEGWVRCRCQPCRRRRLKGQRGRRRHRER
mmetsp:Transcript_76940/g.152633  ORF Transcript_76940/g.152633 Transcript_76940/m.152633 type:complete len:271 (-) Transcript_76940:242-1054(-)